MPKAKLYEPDPNILQLYKQGYSNKEIAQKLKLGTATVWRHLKLIDIDIDYFDDLIIQSIAILKLKQKAYCFTKEQLDAIKERYSNFVVGHSDGCYILYPR